MNLQQGKGTRKVASANFEELPDYLREGINGHFARTYREVLQYAFCDHWRDKSLH